MKDYPIVPLDPGACKLFKTLSGLSRSRGYAFAGYEWLARLFRVCRQTIGKWIRQLADAGLISIERRYHTSSVYRILKELPPARQLTLTFNIDSAPSIITPTEDGRSSERPDRPPVEQKLQEHFGDTRIGGKPADRALITRISRMLGDISGFERFRSITRAWIQRSTPQTWGIFVRLAEDAILPRENQSKQQTVTNHTEESKNVVLQPCGRTPEFLKFCEKMGIQLS
jgi:hypothetical protein